VRFTDIVIEHTGYLDPALRQRKLERNLRLLYLDLAERPNDAFTLFNLGWAYADLGRCGEAIPLLQKSLQHSHNADSITSKLYALLAQCHRRLGQWAEAWAVCQAVQARCPDDAELLFLKGLLSHARGDRVEARRCWMQLLAETRTGEVPVLLCSSVAPASRRGVFGMGTLPRKVGRLRGDAQNVIGVTRKT
jgi:tetratricopeptide (TPR) repeat protein